MIVSIDRPIDRSIRSKFRYGTETFAREGGVAPRFRHEGKGIKMKKKEGKLWYGMV